MKDSLLLDTSFFIRLLKDDDPLHQTAMNYYQYFLDNEIPIKISTVSIAEYCVRGKITDLPFRHLQVIPFNLNHAKRAGEFAHILHTARAEKTLVIEPRTIIADDSKLFAQADTEKAITRFVTSDKRSKRTFDTLSNQTSLAFQIIDITTTNYQQAFNRLI